MDTRRCRPGPARARRPGRRAGALLGAGRGHGRADWLHARGHGAAVERVRHQREQLLCQSPLHARGIAQPARGAPPEHDVLRRKARSQKEKKNGKAKTSLYGLRVDATPMTDGAFKKEPQECNKGFNLRFNVKPVPFLV